MAYIEKEPIIKFITDGLNNPDKTKAFGHDAIEMLTEIDFAPASDVVEVVRCKNCKYAEIIETNIGAKYIECQSHEVYMEADDFCSYGERKENDA